MEKIATGVNGLDEMLLGGLIPGRAYLVVGGPGAGKTILSMQYLMQGVNNGERCLYVALEEQATQLKQDMSEFGWDISRIRILDTMQNITAGIWALKTPEIQKPEFTLRSLVQALNKMIGTYKPSRIVIDSLTSVKMLYEDRKTARKEILGFINFLENIDCTTLLTAELIAEDIIMEEFLVSGVVKLHLLQNAGERVSAVSVQKYRGSSFDRHMRPVKITSDGMVVFPNESVFG